MYLYEDFPKHLPVQEEADKCYCNSQLTKKYAVNLQDENHFICQQSRYDAGP